MGLYEHRNIDIFLLLFSLLETNEVNNGNYHGLTVGSGIKRYREEARFF